MFSYRTNSPMIMKLGMEHYKLKLYIVYIIDDPGLTLTYFTTMSNLAKDYVCTYTCLGPDNQVSVYRTIGPLVLDLYTQPPYNFGSDWPWCKRVFNTTLNLENNS